MANSLTYKGYAAKVEFDATDEILYGKIEGIDDLVSFEAADAKQIETSFHDAVDEYLDFCKENGKEPNKAYKGTFNVRIDPRLHRDLAMKAVREGTSLNQAVETAIRHEIEGNWGNRPQFSVDAAALAGTCQRTDIELIATTARMH